MKTSRLLAIMAIVSLFLLPIGVLAQDGTPTAQEVTFVDKITFGEVEGQSLNMSVYLPPERATPRPAILAIHGGGMIDTGGSVLPAAKAFAEHGYVTFSVDYRLLDYRKGKNLWPAQLDDVQRAVRWIRANADQYGVDPSRICAYGRSSGGFLASLLGTMDTRDNSDSALATYSSRVTCVVDIAGESDFSIPYLDPTWTNVNTILFGGSIEQVPDQYRDASPINHVDDKTVPFLIFQAIEDTAVPVEHGRRMLDALNAQGIEVVYIEIPGIGHMDLADLELANPFILPFFARHLHPAE